MSITMPECPFCRSNEHVKYAEALIGNFVYCLNCEAQGPTIQAGAINKAIESWASIQRDRARLEQLEAQIADGEAEQPAAELTDDDESALWDAAMDLMAGLGDAPDPEAAQ
jgi:hypothetical protein